jgi:hypothetical protein
MHKVTVRYSEAEFTAVTAAAERAGMAVAAYIGQTGLDAAEFRSMPVPARQREILTALTWAGHHLRQVVPLLTQAVDRLNVPGQNGAGGLAADLARAAAYLTQVARHVDQAAVQFRRQVPR